VAVAQKRAGDDQGASETLAMARSRGFDADEVSPREWNLLKELRD